MSPCLPASPRIRFSASKRARGGGSPPPAKHRDRGYTAANAPAASGAAALRFDLVPDQRSDVGAAKIFDRADAGRRGDVDLGQKAADHIDADEQEAPLAERRPEPG